MVDGWLNDKENIYLHIYINLNNNIQVPILLNFYKKNIIYLSISHKFIIYIFFKCKGAITYITTTFCNLNIIELHLLVLFFPFTKNQI